MLKRLLAGLVSPYRYDVNRIYYDWSERCWKDLPVQEEPEVIIERAISDYEYDRDIDALSELADRVREALERLDAAPEDEVTSDERV